MKKAYLAPDVLLKMIINDKEDYLGKFTKHKKIRVVTSAFCFWEVMSCLTKKEIEKYSDRIINVFQKTPITDMKDITGKFKVEDKKRIVHLRKIALKD